MEGEKMKKNYKLQNTNYKQITNYNVRNYKQKNNQKFLRMFHGTQEKKKEDTKLRRLKASISFLYTNSNEFYNIPQFDAFTVGPIHLKKPSGGPKGLIGPPCHGAPGCRRQKNDQLA